MVTPRHEGAYAGSKPRGDKVGQRKRAWVVVLGDFGRSPRMQYNALSLAEQVRVYTLKSHAATHSSDRHATGAICTVLPSECLQYETLRLGPVKAQMSTDLAMAH